MRLFYQIIPPKPLHGLSMHINDNMPTKRRTCTPFREVKWIYICLQVLYEQHFIFLRSKRRLATLIYNFGRKPVWIMGQNFSTTQIGYFIFLIYFLYFLKMKHSCEFYESSSFFLFYDYMENHISSQENVSKLQEIEVSIVFLNMKSGTKRRTCTPFWVL